MKRYRTPTAKPGELKAAYGRADRYSEPSVVYVWGGDGAAKGDARMLASLIEDKRKEYAFPSMQIEDRPSLIEELEARGYDITTLRITVQQKATPPLPESADSGR